MSEENESRIAGAAVTAANAFDRLVKIVGARREIRAREMGRGKQKARAMKKPSTKTRPLPLITTRSAKPRRDDGLYRRTARRVAVRKRVR